MIYPSKAFRSGPTFFGAVSFTRTMKKSVAIFLSDRPGETLQRWTTLLGLGCSLKQSYLRPEQASNLSINPLDKITIYIIFTLNDHKFTTNMLYLRSGERKRVFVGVRSAQKSWNHSESHHWVSCGNLSNGAGLAFFSGALCGWTESFVAGLLRSIWGSCL